MNPLLAALPLLLAAALPAQRIVVVDANNGPGTDHTTLAGAFAALLNGDVLIVRAGTYTGGSFTTSHSFVMLGEGSPVIEPAPSTTATLRITMNGSQYQRIAMRGIYCHSQTSGQWALNVRTNYNFWPAPTVHLEDCQMLSFSSQADRVGLLAESVGLTAQRCTMNTSQVNACLATFVGCTITGLDQFGTPPLSQHAQTALDVIRSEVWIVDSLLQAGDSHGVYGSPASCLGFTENSYTTVSHVHVAGASTLRADQQPSPLWPVPFVIRNYQTWWQLPSVFEYEPGVVLQPAPTGPTFSAGLALSQQTVPSLRASTAPLGGAWTCTAHSELNDIVILLASTQSHAGYALGLPVLLDATIAWIVGFDLIGASGEATLPAVAIPNDQSLLGLVLEASSASLTPAGALLVSNPVAGIVQ